MPDKPECHAQLGHDNNQPRSHAGGADIVERLRAYADELLHEAGLPNLFWEAAAEIERLQEHKRKQMADIMNLGQQVGKLEAKIERLTAALKEIGRGGDDWRRLANIARSALERQ